MYEEKSFDGDQVWNVIELLYHPGTYDSYCQKCGKETTFQITPPQLPAQFNRNTALENLSRNHGIPITYPTLERTIYQVVAQCARQSSHIQRFLFLVDSHADRDDKGKHRTRNTIQKIGQHPSFADLSLPKVKKYAPVLDKLLLGDLSRAIGLASHDVGIGAYTYLRRVFEALIEDAHRAALSTKGWDEQIFVKSRMAERIALLKAHLPMFLVENPGMYSLLSKGIHELSEVECMEHFHTLRIAIELILDEKLEHREKTRKMAEAKKALAQAISKHA